MFDWRQLASLGRDARVPYVLELFLERGFVRPERIAVSFARLLDLPIFVIAAERVIAHIAKAGSPERALLALEDAVETLENTRGDASPLLIDDILRLFVELAGASPRAGRLLSGDPLLAIEFGARFTTIESAFRPDYADGFARIHARAQHDTALFDRLIRRYRNRQLLRIALRELREGDVRETSAELAELAEAAIQAALDHHLPILTAELGPPDPPCAHAVFGLGKLGGRELDFSSAIDLLYFYEHDESRAVHDFFVKLFERVTRSIDQRTEHGLVFRVELELRPEGKSGAIANSIAGAERYYETWGRAWERAAWIKARPIAGSRALGEALLQRLRPFIWRKSFDMKAIEEVFELKTQIEDARLRSARGGPASGVDLQLGKGGSCEIEVFAQSYQLLHGGRDPNLRVTNTIDALAQLEAAGQISAKTRVELSGAYLFLRRIEHRVQIVEEQQTHHLPAEPEAAEALARSLSFGSTEAMHAALAKTMDAAHAVFADLLGAAKEEDSAAPEIDLLLDPSVPEEEKLAAFSRLGARDPHSALAQLVRAARHPRSLFHPHANDAIRSLARRLLDDCCASPSVDRALKHLPQLSAALRTHASYLEELARPTLRRGIARVLGASDLLARILVSTPALVPHVLMAETLPPLDAVARELEARLEGVTAPEPALAVLRAIKQEEVLRTAIADLGGAIETAQVDERLTVLAEQLIARALRLAEAEMSARYGAPQPSAEMVVIAGGALGAREMGYRSDVELSFIYDGDGELCRRIAQRLLSFLTLGELYSSEMRVRPSGKQGALVSSRASFELYHQKPAQLWERSTLLRARVIAGSPALAEAMTASIERAAYEAPPPDQLAAELRALRRALEEERSPRRRPASVDLRLGEGGLAEAELSAQGLLLQHGREHLELRTPSTRRALAALAGAGLLKKSTAERVIRAFDRLRTLQNWLRIAHDEALDHLDLSDETLRPLALSTGYAGDSAEKLLLRDLRADTAAIHLCYEEVLGILR